MKQLEKPAPLEPLQRARRRYVWCLVFAGVVQAVACDRSTTRPAAESRSSAAPTASSAGEPKRIEPLSYVELPPRARATNGTLPMVVAIHGLGDRPEDFARIFASFDAPARIVLPRAPDAWGAGFSWFAFRRGADPALGADGIAHSAERLAATLTVLVRERKTRGKPIVTGFSQGGALSFALAVRHPELIGAAFPIGGWIPEPLWPALDAGAASTPRIVAYHGEADELVPVTETRRSVEALKALAMPVELRAFPGVGHTISEAMLKDWLAELAEACRRAEAQ